MEFEGLSMLGFDTDSIEIQYSELEPYVKMFLLEIEVQNTFIIPYSSNKLNFRNSCTLNWYEYLQRQKYC